MIDRVIRQKILERVRAGESIRAAARAFGISPSTVSYWIRQMKDEPASGATAPAPAPEPAPAPAQEPVPDPVPAPGPEPAPAPGPADVFRALAAELAAPAPEPAPTPKPPAAGPPAIDPEDLVRYYRTARQQIVEAYVAFAGLKVEQDELKEILKPNPLVELVIRLNAASVTPYVGSILGRGEIAVLAAVGIDAATLLRRVKSVAQPVAPAPEPAPAPGPVVAPVPVPSAEEGLPAPAIIDAPRE